MPSACGNTALGDLSILDFSRVLAGPLATMLLADLGATVTKVERPGTGDDTRAWGPPYDLDGQATYFQSVNRNKNSLVLDLSDPRDSELARRRAHDADVVVENFRPGVMDQFGLGYDDLRATNPGIVYCSITGFGRGAGADLPAYDLLIQAVGGLMSITGPRDGDPQKVGVALVDVLAGLFATVGILAALRFRDATGEGQRVEVDLLSALLAGLVNQASAYTSGGVVATRMGNEHPSIAPYELVRCEGNDTFVLAVGNDRQFADLCDVIGAPALAQDSRFATNALRVEHRAQLRAELEHYLASASAARWVEALTERRVPAGAVNDVAQAFALATRLGLEPIISIPRGDGTAVRLPRNPIMLSTTPPVYCTAPPALGQHRPDAPPTTP